jgi:cadmium resistance protein CadD (predicted permease)
VVQPQIGLNGSYPVSAFFSDARLAPHAVVIGQFVGIGTLVLVSIIAARLALAVPEGWVALLGLAPLVLGVSKLLTLRQVAAQDVIFHIMWDHGHFW